MYIVDVVKVVVQWPRPASKLGDFVKIFTKSILNREVILKISYITPVLSIYLYVCLTCVFTFEKLDCGLVFRGAISIFGLEVHTKVSILTH